MGESSSTASGTPWFKYCYGDIDRAAIFLLEGRGYLIGLIRSVKQEAQDMYTLFETHKIEAEAVMGQLAWHFQTANVKADPHMQSAKAVSTAAMIFRKFPDVTIDIHVLQRKVWEAKWLRSTVSNMMKSQVHMTTSRVTPPSLEPYELDLACAFACVTMFDSGHYDADPAELVNVMAMSSGDSLYVGAALLCDPSEDLFSGDIKRIAGNIGRPGIAFLVPPLAPLLKKVSINEWPC